MRVDRLAGGDPVRSLMGQTPFVKRALASLPAHLPPGFPGERGGAKCQNLRNCLQASGRQHIWEHTHHPYLLPKLNECQAVNS